MENFLLNTINRIIIRLPIFMIAFIFFLISGTFVSNLDIFNNIRNLFHKFEIGTITSSVFMMVFIVTVIYMIYTIIVKVLQFIWWILNGIPEGFYKNILLMRNLYECFDGKHESEKNVLKWIMSGSEEKLPYEAQVFSRKETLLILKKKRIVANAMSYPYIEDWAKKYVENELKKNNVKRENNYDNENECK